MMNLRRIRAIAVKESLQIIRDPRSMMIALLIPLLQMFMFGYGVSLDVKGIPLCVLDEENSLQSRELIALFAASPYFAAPEYPGSQAAVSRSLDSGRCELALVVAADFSRQLNDRGQGRLQVLLDGTDSNTANIAANYAKAVVGGFSQNLQLERIQRRGGSAQSLTPVDVAARAFRKTLD